MGDAEPVEVPRQVYCELKTMRQMGVDPSDPDAVVAGLDAYNFEAALEWILDNPERYVEVVDSGMTDGTATRDET